jgi:hypothetical protein
MPAVIGGSFVASLSRRMYTNAFGTPTWFSTFASSRPGVTTRPERRVGCPASLQSFTAEQSPHGSPPRPDTHSVGAPTPPWQISSGPHVRPSSSQLIIVPQSSTR